MKIEKRITKDGYTQITTLDERWYDIKGVFVPSVTWIAGYYPKGIGFMKWLASHGWDEAEAIKQEAGDKGSKVHHIVDDLIKGKEVNMDHKYTNPTSGDKEEITADEWAAVISFFDWWTKVKPVVLSNEFVVVSKEEEGYAGTVDLLCRINNENWLIDFKTSQSIWASAELQVSAYKHAYEEMQDVIKVDKLGILQIGYRLNKRGWKLNEIEDQYSLFLSIKDVWEKENKNVRPKQKDYPMSLKLNVTRIWKKIGKK